MLEVWDVVDKASKRNISESLTLARKGDAESGTHTFPLDATVIDVYRNAHAVLFLIDPSKKWTYEYVRRELPLVPEHIPTCVLLNFRDYPASKRTIRPERVERDCELSHSNRPFRPFVIETSLLNCYGLPALSTFLHIPFLCLKRAGLERALALNASSVAQAQEALKTVQSDEYEEYERRIERSVGGGGGGASGTGEGSARRAGETVSAGAVASAGTPTGTASKRSHRLSPASPEEAAITWKKLSATTLGEAPLLLGSAAVSSLLSGVAAVASVTPAEIAASVQSRVSSLASLENLGLATKAKGHFNDAPLERVAPQFSHLAGRGGASAAAFGGEDIDDDDSDAGPKPGMSGGGEHPDVGVVDEDFFAQSPRAGDAGAGDPRRDWDEESDGDAEAERDGDRANPRASVDGVAEVPSKASNPIVRWDDDDESSEDEMRSDGASKDARVDDDGGDPLTNVSETPVVGVVRQISADDPFFGAAGKEKKPFSKNGVADSRRTALRAVEVDLDPSAIAAQFGTPGTRETGADSSAYETVDDVASADFLNKSLSRLEGGGPMDRNERGGGGAKKKKKKKKEMTTHVSSAADDDARLFLRDAKDSADLKKERKKKKEKEKTSSSSLSESSFSFSKKTKKGTKDWDESD
jgi:hypothetical protein